LRRALHPKAFLASAVSDRCGCNPRRLATNGEGERHQLREPRVRETLIE
jgi:hypothetical protein